MFKSPFRFVLVLVCLAFFCAKNIHADTTTTEFAFNGSITAVGTNVCTPSPCTEVIDFSLIWAWQYSALWSDPTTTVYQGSFVSEDVNSSGALGAMTGFGQFQEGLFAPLYGDGAEIDLLIDDPNLTTFDPTVPPTFSAQFYTCFEDCNDKFSNIAYEHDGDQGATGDGGSFILAYTVTQVPEPSSLVLSFCGAPLFGMLVIGVAWRRRQNERP
jgi:hypothetical protein